MSNKITVEKLNPSNLKEITNVRLGSDPEFFIVDKNTGEHKSAVGLIGGSKDLPRFLKAGYGVQEDNVALELTLPPTNSYIKMYNDCEWILDKINKELEGKDLMVLNDDSADAISFSDQELDTDEARLFGCSPSFNFWNLEMNEPPKATDSNLRSIGKHLHVSYKDRTYETDLNLLRVLDLYLTVPSIIMNPNGALRRKLYGKAGEHRIGSVTAELRTLGINWFQSKEHTKFVFDNTFAAIDKINNEKFVMDEHMDDCLAIINCVNNNDSDVAKYLCDKYNINYTIENQENKSIKKSASVEEAI
jgi:hypothetical protein